MYLHETQQLLYETFFVTYTGSEIRCRPLMNETPCIDYRKNI